MDEKARAEENPGQRTTAEPNPVPPLAVPDATTALDPTNSTGNMPTPSLERNEPPVTEADQPAPQANKSLSFLAPAAQPGSLGRLGHYEVLEVLGRGAFGIVFKALDDKLQRLVALKVLGPQLAGSATARGRFLREARAAAAVRSKHVVNTYEVIEQPLPYLAMEYVAGQTLQDRLDRGEPLDTREILVVGAEIAEGLAAAHAQGLIHRDIKPANILLAESPHQKTTVKIADFGLARAVDDASLTQSGVIAGTPMFMSPEQARGDPLDHRSDLFSLGSVLYTLCTGQPPFRASKTLAVLKRVCDDTPQPIRALNPHIPEALAAVVARLLVKDPAGRLQSAQAVAELLRQHRAHLDDPSLPPPSDSLVGAVLLETAPTRRRWLGGVAAACVVLALVGGLLLYQPWSSSTDADNPDARSEPPPPRKPEPAEVANAARGAAARGHEFCRRGEWAAAAKEALAEVAASPENRILWATAAARLLMAGDVVGYRQLCGRMVEQFRGTTVPEQADSVCKVCLLLPSTVARSQLPSAVLAKGLVSEAGSAHYRGWFYACAALIAYRDGQFEQAVAEGDKSHAITNRVSQPGALTLVVQAMAQHQLKQGEQAQQLLSDATSRIPAELATLGAVDFKGTLPVDSKIVATDWLIAELLRREAALLIHKNAQRTDDIAATLRNQGLQLFNEGNLDGALATLRQALEREERHAETHRLIGVILFRQQKSDEATKAFRRAIEIAPAAPSYVWLGFVLHQQGKRKEADALLNDAIKLFPKHPPLQQLHAEVVRLLALEAKLESFLDGTAKPAGTTQRLDLVRLCQERQLYVAAARFFADAQAADPKLVASPGQVHRYNAACAAALAAAGKGQDAGKLEEPERVRLRKQALDWLRADLDQWSKSLTSGKPSARAELQRALKHWQQDSDLVGLRDKDALGQLTPEEQRACQQLWSDVAGVLHQAEEGRVPATALDQARTLAERKQWKEAAAAYAQVIDQPHPDWGHVAFEYAAVLLLADDREGYRKLCARAVEKCGAPGVRSYHAARACTLAPDSVAPAERPGELARKELAEAGTVYWSLWLQGALHYRAGRYQEAVPLFEGSRDDKTHAVAGVVCVRLWLALTHQRLGQTELARREFARAEDWLKQYPEALPPNAEKLGVHLHNWLEIHVLRREAEKLLQAAPRKQP